MNSCVQLVSRYFPAINDLSISDFTPAVHVKRHTKNACSDAHSVDHSRFEISFCAKELQSISDDPYARIVSSFVGEERFHIIVSVASKNLKQQRLSLLQKRLYGNRA